MVRTTRTAPNVSLELIYFGHAQLDWCKRLGTMWLGRRPCGWQSAETKLFADSVILAIIIISSSILNRPGALVSWIFRFHFTKSYSSFVLRATLPIVTNRDLFHSALAQPACQATAALSCQEGLAETLSYKLNSSRHEPIYTHLRTTIILENAILYHTSALTASLSYKHMVLRCVKGLTNQISPLD